MEPQQSYYTAHTDFEYPEDGQEQENEFRERALDMIRIMSLALYHVINSRTPNVTAFGVAYALGLKSVLGNERMAQRARKLGVHKAAISRAASKFLAESGLPPSLMMQQTEHAAMKRRPVKKLEAPRKKTPEQIMKAYGTGKKRFEENQMILDLFKV